MIAFSRLARLSGLVVGAVYGSRLGGLLAAKWLGRSAAHAAEEITKEAAVEAP